MKRVCRLALALCLALGATASSALGADLMSPRANKAGTDILPVPAQNSITETICTVPARPGVTIHASSSNPACLTVTPASAVTGGNGCADFTVRCVNGACTASVTWFAAGFNPLTLHYRCVVGQTDSLPYHPMEPPHPISQTPTLGTWGIIAMSLMLMGGAVLALLARRRRA